MNAFKMTATRRRDQVVILTGVRYGSKLSTRPAARSMSPFAAFCLALLGVLFFFCALLGVLVIGGETALACGLSLALPLLVYSLKKGGLL